MSQVAAAAHAPFISAASSELLNLESFTQLDAPRDLAKIFDTTEYARWKGFRDVGGFALRVPDLAARADCACPMARTPSRWTASTTKRA